LPGFCARGRFVEHRRHCGDLLVRERRKLAREPVQEQHGVRIAAGGIDLDLRLGQVGEAQKLVGLVPDDAEVLEHALEQGPGRLAALAALERRQVGDGDAEMRRHVLEEEPALAPQLADAAAERRHGSPGARRRRSRT
jgi:hypothetical protein